MDKKRQLIIYSVLAVLFLVNLFLVNLKSLAVSYNVTVSGVVAPNQNDYTLSVTSNKAGQIIPQGTLITYTLTYGGANNSAFTTGTTLTVNYSNDSPDGGVTHVTDYVVGSATDAVNNTIPVIDPVKRTISWNIANFDSAQTNLTVQFQLLTNSDYAGSNNVPIVTTADLSNVYVTMPTVSTTTTYLYNTNLTPTPTNIPTATATPTPSPTITPISTPGSTLVQPSSTPALLTPTPTASPTSTPTPVFAPPRYGILTVDVSDLLPTQAQLLIQSVKTVKLNIKYGTQLNQLNSSFNIRPTGLDTITLKPLQPNTSYYIQITALGANDQVLNKDTFTIHTPLIANKPIINPSSLVLNADGISINKSDFLLQSINTPQSFLLPIDNPYSIFISFSYAQGLNSVQAILQPIRAVASSQSLLPTDYATPMYERSPNSYVASLISPINPGIYNLEIKSITSAGIIEQQTVGSLSVLQPLHVYDNDNITPLNDARVYIQFYDFKKKQYMPLQTIYPQIKNPLFTRADGTVDFPFPADKYRITVSAFGHEEKIIDFSIGLNDQNKFPQISLHQDYWNIGYFVRFLRETTADFLNTVGTEIYLIGSRQSYFFLLAIILVPLSLGFLAFFARTHMTPRTLLHFMHHRISNGVIYRLLLHDEDNKPVSDAEIYLINNADIVTYESKTNALGVCYAQILDFRDVSIRILKPGFEPIEEKLEHYQAQNQIINIQLSKKPLVQHHKIHILMYLSKEILGTLLEAFLLLSLLSEVLFAFQFGLLTTAPFLLLSLLNTVFWISYLQDKNNK